MTHISVLSAPPASPVPLPRREAGLPTTPKLQSALPTGLPSGLCPALTATHDHGHVCIQVSRRLELRDYTPHYRRHGE